MGIIKTKFSLVVSGYLWGVGGGGCHQSGEREISVVSMFYLSGGQ